RGREDDEEQHGNGDRRTRPHRYAGPWSRPDTVVPGGTSVTADAGSSAHSAAAEPRSRASDAKPYESTSSTSSDGLASAYVCNHRTERACSPKRTSIAASGSAPCARSSSGSTLSWQLPNRSIHHTSPWTAPPSSCRGSDTSPGTSPAASTSSPDSEGRKSTRLNSSHGSSS